MVGRSRIGVIGTGGMGGRHARNLAGSIKGADLVALMDLDHERASALAKDCGGARVFDDGFALIRDPDVDAVIIASPDATHAELALACLEVGKPVLCEKPLATDVETAAIVAQTEAKLGKRCIQLGFMRVYDPAHLAVKEALDRSSLGKPLMFRGVHNNLMPGRKRSVADVATNSAVHDFHSACWLMQDDIETVTAKHVPASTEEPDSCRLMLIQLAFKNGALGTIEVNADSGYGYEVTVEITGEHGLVRSADYAGVTAWHSHKRSVEIPPDWLVRFERAYIDELHAWVQALKQGVVTGPSAWDGYRSLAVADAAIRSIDKGRPEPVKTIAKPPLYAS
ncbi:MAG: Gfo/Idh/MocA family oxidoreductase [Alphaproteobacteria bacterium]|nr:Gfo/Idh/MocA family oxidoreductase [Alphaproteobacteria bacterium]